VRIAIAIAVMLPILGGCSPRTNEPPKDDGLVHDHGGGTEYKEALLGLLSRTDRIVATEHSSEFDLYDPETGESGVPKTIIYGTHELTAAEIEYFTATIKSLDPTTQDAFAACVPEVHHTFRFYSGQRLIDTMDICFECGEVLWSGTGATPPWSLYSGLAKVVKHIGFTPDRDWPAVARQHLK